MYYLGIDTANVNCGYAILKIDESSILVTYAKTIITQEQYKESDITKSYYQIHFLDSLLSKLHNDTLDCIAMESPAFSYKAKMVSIGIVHGAFLVKLLSLGSDFGWIPPTKLRYAFLGNGFATKAEGVSFVKNNFPFSWDLNTYPIDDNMADAIMLAYCAYLLRQFLLNDKFDISHFSELVRKRLRFIFLDEKSGILYHPYQFYYSKSLNLYKDGSC